MMIEAKRLARALNADKPDIAAVTAALTDYETSLKAVEQASGEAKIGSFFVSGAKAYLTSAKQLMRRIRDKKPFSRGDQMMINAGGGEMIEGTPQRLLRDYNSLIEAYNRGVGI
jgi:seryl-tRNA(Sec) selenium transferase